MHDSGGRRALIAAASTVIAAGLTIWLIVTRPTWPRVRDQFFSLEQAREVWPDILSGFWLDMKMFVIAQIAILILALLVAIIRSLRGPAFFPLRLLSIIYIDLFRGIPLVLAVLLFGFGIPALQIPHVPSDPMFWGVVTLVLSYSAYTAEVYRSGIDAVPESQRSSARALGLTQFQALRFAILPQAIRNVVPALLNGLVSLQKDVALVSLLGVREAVRSAQISSARTFNYTGYVVAAVLFLIVSVPAARFADWFTERDRKLRNQGL